MAVVRGMTGVGGSGEGGSSRHGSNRCSNPNGIHTKASRCLGRGAHPETSSHRSKDCTTGTTGSSGPAASQPGQGPRPDPLLQRLLRHRLHPTFNARTPRGRVMAELHDMLVRHVEPAADRWVRTRLGGGAGTRARHVQ